MHICAHSGAGSSRAHFDEAGVVEACFAVLEDICRAVPERLCSELASLSFMVLTDTCIILETQGGCDVQSFEMLLLCGSLIEGLPPCLWSARLPGAYLIPGSV